MRSPKVRFWIGGIACALGGSAAAQHSAVLPESGQWLATPSVTFSTFDEYWRARDHQSLPHRVNQGSAWINLEYGIFSSVAADFTVGYTWIDTTDAFSPQFDGGTDHGLADTRLGLRWRFMDEEDSALPFAPTMALRLGGIIEGTYDDNIAFPAGDGASGVEGSVLFTRHLFRTIGLFGELGVRDRTHDVPQEFLGAVGLYGSYRWLHASVGYRHAQSLSGGDIGDPGFGEQFGFPQLKEITQTVETSAGVRDRGGRSYQVFYSHVIEGRNTPQSDRFGLSISFLF